MSKLRELIATSLPERGHKGLQRSLSRGPAAGKGASPKRMAKAALAVAMTGATGVGWGTAVIGDFPEGNILFLGAVAYCSLDEDGDAGIVDTFDADFSVGTTAADDGTLTAGDVDIIPSTTIAQAVSGVTPSARAEHAAATTGVVFDNTDGSLEINLNLLIDDADISADVPVLATYDVAISYVVLGDD